MPFRGWQLILFVMAQGRPPWVPPFASAQSDMMSEIDFGATTMDTGSDTSTMPAALTQDAPSTTNTAAAATATAVTTTGGSAAAASTVAPSISYPAAGGINVRYNDVILVQYNSAWSSTTLRLFCMSMAAGAPGGYTPSDPKSLSSQQGTVPVSPEDLIPNLSNFPYECHFEIHNDSGSKNGDFNGNDFVVNGKEITGNDGVPTTYGSTSTGTAPASIQTFTDITGAAGATRSGSGGRASNTASSTGAGYAAASETAAAGSSGSSSSSSGLSAGAKAGIAIGVILIFILLALAFLLYRRRERQKHKAQIAAMQSELESERAKYATEKAYLDSILKVAGKPDTAHGGKIRIADDVRQSGDWRRFFSSTAASAAGSVAGAAAAVGAVMTGSRPSSRRQSLARSMLSTRDGPSSKDLPPVPKIPRKPVPTTVTALPPSPSVKEHGQQGGRGSPEGGDSTSTTGLIGPSKR